MASCRLPREGYGLLIGVALALAPLSASAQAGAGEEAVDPLRAASERLWRLVEEKCVPADGRGWDVAVVGALPENLNFSADEKEMLALKLSGAFSALFQGKSGARVRNYRELGDMIAIMGTGESRAAVDEFLRKGQENINLMIVAYGTRTATRPRLILRAMGYNGLTCGEQTDTFELPRGYLPEKVYSPDELLSRAAQHVLERTKGRNRQMVWIRSRLADGHPAPEVWSESLARSFNRAVPLARSRLPSRSLEATDVHAEATMNYEDSKDWSTELTLDPYAPDGAHVEVEVRPPDGVAQDGTAFDGIVDRDKLPPLPSPKASDLPLSTEAPRRFEVALDGKERRELAFSLPRSMVIEVDLQSVEGTAAPVVAILDQRGTLRRMENAPGKLRPHLQRWRLEAGRYSLWLQGVVKQQTRFTVRTRAAFDALAPEPVAEFGSVAGDWVVGGSDLPDGRRRCFAFTPALGIEPIDWRLQKPFLLFQMSSTSDDVSHRFDDASVWNMPDRVVANVSVRNRWERLSLVPAADGTLQSLVACRGEIGASCLAETTIRSLTAGRRLQMEGVTSDGRPGRVDYSLEGYQAAMFSMARLCNRRDYAARLVLP